MKHLRHPIVDRISSRLYPKKPLIQVLMGPRQVGKTTSVHQFLSEYKGKYHFCSADDIPAGGRQWLLNQWQSVNELGKNNLLVIDEIQKVFNWSETIKKLWDSQMRESHGFTKLLLLGSSSLELQKGLSESLAGRFELIRMYHWNYIESQKLKPKLSLDDYFQFGGYPASYELLTDIKRWRDYINSSVIDMVINKDILGISQVKKIALFRQSFEVFCSYPSRTISYTKLLGQLQDKGNTDLIKTYLRLYEGAFLFRPIQKFSQQDYKNRASSPKIISMAPCFTTALSIKSFEEQRPWIFESCVGAQLARYFDQLFYWREAEDREVDFVVNNGKKLIAIEIKSGRKKSQKGLEQFQKKFPEAKVLSINESNFFRFLENTQQFLKLAV